MMFKKHIIASESIKSSEKQFQNQPSFNFFFSTKPFIDSQLVAYISTYKQILYIKDY